MVKFTFRISNKKNKKYDAVFEDGRVVSFGDRRYQQFRDSTGLGAYTAFDHNDKDRRRMYRARHSETAKVKYSPSWFALNYLW